MVKRRSAGTEAAKGPRFDSPLRLAFLLFENCALSNLLRLGRLGLVVKAFGWKAAEGPRFDSPLRFAFLFFKKCGLWTLLHLFVSRLGLVVKALGWY